MEDIIAEAVSKTEVIAYRSCLRMLEALPVNQVIAELQRRVADGESDQSSRSK